MELAKICMSIAEMKYQEFFQVTKYPKPICKTFAPTETPGLQAGVLTITPQELYSIPNNM